jgi:hypothetical protein
MVPEELGQGHGLVLQPDHVLIVWEEFDGVTAKDGRAARLEAEDEAAGSDVQP